MRFFLLLLLIPQLSWAAPTFDAVTISKATGVVSQTFTHTVSGGCANNIIIVSNWIAAGTPTVSSITIDGNTATSVGSAASPGYSTKRISMYRRVGNTTGTPLTIVVTYDDASNDVVASARSYCGVDQSTPMGTAATATDGGGGTSTATVNVTSASGELVIDSALGDSQFGALTMTVGAGQTQRTNTTQAGLGDFVVVESDKTGAGSVTMSWTLNEYSSYWATVGVSLKPAGATTAAKRRIMTSQ